ncbi:MAG: FKBP-type peptidyl-prolyl cis-trans isomerase [Crocinitomicaceae bacterium]|nr:FKBP-type peptidyl-prolyl cis-trans isomerase [Crocinitomicaceae bacterium]
MSTKEDSLAYALGVSMLENLKQSGLDKINLDSFTKGMKEQKAGSAQMTPDQADNFIRSEMKRINEEKSAVARKAGEEFLAANKNKPGVKTTSSGLQYKVNQQGTGLKPDANDKVTVHYHGTLIDGTVFDSSVDRGQPATFGLNQVIPGWTEGLQLMNEGGKFTFYIPQELGYRANGQGKIGPYSTLIFDVELIKVEPVN